MIRAAHHYPRHRHRPRSRLVPRSIVLLWILLTTLLAAGPASAERGKQVLLSGNRAYTDEDLRKVAVTPMRRFRGQPPEDQGALRADAEDVAFEIGRFYRSKGYPLVSVDAKLVDRGLAVLIVEGPRFTVDEVEVHGTDAGDPGELENFVDLPRTWFLGPRLYVAQDLESAADKMKSWLRQQGYLQAEVTGPLHPPLAETHERALTVRYEIADGPRATLDSIVIEGLRRERFREEIEEILAEIEGKPYSPLVRYDVEAALTEYYGVRGFPFTRIETSESLLKVEEGISAELTVRIDSGPAATIDQVSIRGNVRTRDYVLRRELTFHPGDRYSSRDLGRSQERLFETGLFGQAVFRLVAPGTEEEIREMGREEATAEIEGMGEIEGRPKVPVGVDLEIDEIEFRRLEATVGYGSWELLRGSVSMNWLNLFGTARSARVELGASFRGVKALGRISDPWLLGYPVRGTIEARVEQQERPTFQYFRPAVEATLSKKLAYRLIGSLGYTISRTEVKEVSGDVPDEFENRTDISSITFGLRRETRDNPWAPKQGSLLSGSIEFADSRLGGDIDFVRGRLNAVQVLPLTFLSDRWFLVLHGEAGVIVPVRGTDDIPIQERFFLGGSQTVRSFAESELGPRLDQPGARNTAPAGGEFQSLFNVEIRFPIRGDLRGALFADMGNIIEESGDAGFDDYRFAIGGGLRYITPLGPIRVDLGVNPNPRDHEDRWAVFLAVGYPF